MTEVRLDVHADGSLQHVLTSSPHAASFETDCPGMYRHGGDVPVPEHPIKYELILS
jgi:hypothetical protein